jgi:2-hydroxychromene-2-carboxylate isomerase
MLIKRIMPRVIKLITSPALLEFKRKRAESKRSRNHAPHVITVFLRINDPYSYLLIQVLKSFQARYDIKLEFRTVLKHQSEMIPAPGLWQSNAFKDGESLARLYQLNFPADTPRYSEGMIKQVTAQLLHWELQPDYLDKAEALFDAFWQGSSSKIEELLDSNVVENAECYDHHLLQNEQLLKDTGHYMSAMLNYGGEWYWGIDRLDHLEQRLNALPSAKPLDSKVVFDRTYRDFCCGSVTSDVQLQKTIEYFFSIRSPYSYLGLERVVKLAEHYQAPLVIKPVLPMVMRRMQVPNAKKFYIMGDAKREADKLGLTDFGFLADPLGAGVERCYALYEYAQQEGKAIEFLLSYARGVYNEGILSETDKGLKILVERCGLNWSEAQSLLNDDSWRIWAQQNLAEMYGKGSWGVPSIAYGDVMVFGQDRIFRIEEEIISDLTVEDSHEKTREKTREKTQALSG